MAVTMFAVALAVADEAAKAVPVANRARTMERVVTVSFFKIDSVVVSVFSRKGEFPSTSAIPAAVSRAT
jgi:hypothetical protein